MMFALSSRAARVAAGLCCAAFALAFTPRPASADDVLHVVGGSTPTSFYEVIEDVAQFGGLYKSENLAVDKQYAGSASVCIQLVASGKGDICTASIEPIILGWDKGIRLVSFFSRDPRYDYLLAVAENSPIRTLADFKGQDIGEINVGSTSEISANHMLAGAGVPPGSVHYIPIGVGPQAISAITSGKIAALSFPSVELATYTAIAGLKFRYYRDPILDSIPNVAFNALPATLQTKADLLKRFTRAMVKAAIVIRVNPAFAAKCFLQGAGQKITDEALANETKLLQLTQGDLPASDLSNQRIGYMPVAGIQLYTRFMNDQGLTKTVVPAAAIVSNAFIAQANDFDRKAFIAQAKAMK